MLDALFWDLRFEPGLSPWFGSNASHCRTMWWPERSMSISRDETLNIDIAYVYDILYIPDNSRKLGKIHFQYLSIQARKLCWNFHRCIFKVEKHNKMKHDETRSADWAVSTLRPSFQASLLHKLSTRRHPQHPNHHHCNGHPGERCTWNLKVWTWKHNDVEETPAANRSKIKAINLWC